MADKKGHSLKEVQDHAMNANAYPGTLRRYITETTNSDGNVSFRMVKMDSNGALITVGQYIMTPAEFATLKILNPSLAQAPIGVAGN